MRTFIHNIPGFRLVLTPMLLGLWACPSGGIDPGGTLPPTGDNTTTTTGDTDTLGAPCTPAQGCSGETVCIDKICQPNTIQCGDAAVQSWEECDLGENNSDTGACTTACKFPACGDGFVQDGEECDDGNDDNTDSCVHVIEGDSILCRDNRCGDGFPEAGAEACDDGNRDDNDGCTNNCSAPGCGDGVVQTGTDEYGVDHDEECDDGEANDKNGACTNLCQFARCGDGNTQTGVEECDDGADDIGDDGTPGTTGACIRLPNPSWSDTADADVPEYLCVSAKCGDGFLQDGVEQCDNEASAGCDNVTCKVAENWCCIDGLDCVTKNTVKPNAPCFVCTSASNSTGWTQLAADAPCSDGNACTGTCTGAGCTAMDKCNAQGECIVITDLSQICATQNTSCRTYSCNNNAATYAAACTGTDRLDNTTCPDDNAYCNGVNNCQAGTCTSTDINPCVSAMPVCEEANNQCLRCTATEGCTSELPACLVDEADPLRNTCVKCTATKTSACKGLTTICKTGTNTCVQCTAEDTSACQGLTAKCNTGTNACVQCLGSGDCNDGQYCNGVETCTGNACRSGTPVSCSGATPYCNEQINSCASCGTSAHCTAPTSPCTGYSTCVPNSGNECGSGTQTSTCYRNECNGGSCQNNTGYPSSRSCTKSCTGGRQCIFGICENIGG